MSKFSERLKELMILNGITQEELALRLGVKQPTVSDWIRGKKETDFDTLIEICKVFDESCDYLLGNDREYI